MPLDPSRRYPSPTSTAATSGMQSPIKLGEPLDCPEMRRLGSQASSDDGPPPAKKRKVAVPKERTTEYLDLTKSNDELTSHDNLQMERLLGALRKRKKIVVVAGAGISVSAGIPDFRSSTGLFASTKNQHKLKASGKHLFDASVYRHGSSTQSFHTMVREMTQLTKSAEPTPFHHLLASLAHEGRLLRLYSQNIDCIDTSMEPLATNVPLNPKGPWPATIQLHGGLEKMVCTKCGQLEPFQAELFDGPEPPLCESCKVHDQVRTAHAGKRSHGIGRLRPRFVLYNEYNPDEEAIGNVSSADLKARPDAVLVVGTTLKVPGTRRLVKEMCQVARGRKDGFTAWINVDSEPKGVEFKDCWDLVVRSRCDNVASLAALPPWNFSIGEDYLVSKEQDLESQERRSKTTFEVSLPSSPPKSDANPDVQLAAEPKRAEAIPTPGPSPKIDAAKKPAKTKQAKITFGKQSQDSSAKAPKPRVRKPKKQLVQAESLKNTVMQTFKTAKKVSDHNTAKAGNVEFSAVSVPFREAAQEPFSLPVLRPVQQRGPADALLVKLESENTAQDASPGPLSTPTMKERRLSGETISPPSVPRNMHSLIDME